jgi:hypothetical protein
MKGMIVAEVLMSSSDLPQGHRAITLKWVYKLKWNEAGEIIKHKARLVARGFVQQEGIDFDEVFAPVARMESVCLLLALAAQEGWRVHLMDVKSAFLNGDLKEEIYIRQPVGFIVVGQEGKVLRLRKALYGLRQALCAFLMSDLGLLSFYIGIEVCQDAGGITLRQAHYAKKILEMADMADCKAIATPMERLRLSRDSTAEEVDATLYRRIIGSLRYLINTRPDRFLEQPTEEHL